MGRLRRRRRHVRIRLINLGREEEEEKKEEAFYRRR